MAAGLVAGYLHAVFGGTMMPSRRALLDDLVELLHDEHCEVCDNNTCDIDRAWRLGFHFWAVHMFDSCGAASEKFTKLYDRLAPTQIEIDNDCDRLLQTAHFECSQCEAVIWSRKRKLMLCGNCGKFPGYFWWWGNDFEPVREVE